MVNIIDTLNGTLKNLNNVSSRLSKSSFDLLTRELSSTASSVGIELGQVQNGIKSLTQELDDVIESLPASQLTQIVNKTGVAEITSKIPGYNLDVPAVIIGSAAPEALAAAMKEVKAKKPDIQLALKTIQPVDFGGLNAIIESAFDPKASFSNLKNEVFRNATRELQSILNKVDTGIGSVLGDVLEGQLQTVASSLNKLAIKDGVIQQIPDSVKKNIASLIAQKDFTQAAKLLKGYSNATQQELISSLSKIDTSLSNASQSLAPKSGGSITPRRGGSTQGKNVRNTEVVDNVFPFVMNEEELTVELKDISREITECIIQWTETTKDQSLTAKDFNDLLGQKGESIPYHYLILRNGNLQRSRPVKQVGGKLNNGHEKYAIQIAFVGGIDANSGVKDYTQYLSSKSLTVQQRKTLYTFLRILYSAYPGIQVLGHNSIDIKQKAPGFSVENYINEVFGKVNIIDNADEQGPLSRDQLINKSVN